jgi:COMPASS component SWD3
VDFNRDGTIIVSGSYDGLVRIWDTATGECLKTVYAEGNPPVGGVRFSPNGRFVLTGTLDSKLRLYDLSVTGSGSGRGGGGGKTTKTQQQQPRGGKCAKTYAGHTNTKYCTFASFLVSSSSNLNNIDNSSSSNLNNIDNNNNNYCRRRARSCVISGSEDGKVYLYDLQSRLIQQTLEGHTDAVLAVDAHDTLELIGSGGMANDKCVRFWAPL